MAGASPTRAAKPSAEKLSSKNSKPLFRGVQARREFLGVLYGLLSMSEISDAKNEHLPVYWVKVPVLYHRKTKRALHQYAGYIVSAPARETSPGKFTPIETFQELERFRGGGGGSTGQGGDGTSEKAEEFKKLEQYFARDKRTIRGGVKDGRVKPSSLRDTSNLCDLEVRLIVLCFVYCGLGFGFSRQKFTHAYARSLVRFLKRTTSRTRSASVTTKV